jgi:uncharacterized protein (TIGR03083 family)
MRALLATLDDIELSAPSWCLGWSARDIASHVGAAAQERANLVEEFLEGKPPRPTRSWEEREPPFRRLTDSNLKDALLDEAERFEAVVSQMPDTATITYTGWEMDAARLRMHSHSEAVLHRWDLTGDDETSVRQLSEPALVEHVIAVFNSIPLPEAKRWLECEGICLRVPGDADVHVVAGSGLTRDHASQGGRSLELQAYERVLVLWGRRPERLRDPQDPAESFDELLSRLLAAS